MLLEQIKLVEAERDALFAAAKVATAATPAPVTMLLEIKGIGPEFAAILWMEAFFRSFANRKQIAAYAGLAPTPWQSGAADPGRRTASNHGLKSRFSDWSRLPEPHPPQAGF